MRRQLALLTILTCAACVEPAADDLDAVGAPLTRRGSFTPRPRTYPTEARACRSDALFVDVPLHLDPAWRDLAFVPRLEAELESRVELSNQAWFCLGRAGCLGEAVRVEARSVLPERRDPFRGDGHLRFLRIRFFGAKSGRGLSLTDAAQCAAVAAARAAVSLTAGVPADTYWVGRECDALAASLESQPSAQMLTWHLDALGLPGGAATLPAAAPSGRVDLALVDSGVLPGVGSAVGLATSFDAVGTPGLHEHGSAMALLSRQLAPQAGLHDVRALAAGGAGTSEGLATALDEAVFGAGSSRPLVVNLSLGWPAELSRTARIRGGTCSSFEDPFGEAVRYVLDAARRLDDSGGRPVFISAAAGNRPRPVPAALFPPPPSGIVDHECSPPSPGPALFVPGDYARVDSCRAAAPDLRLTHAASVVDARHRPATLSIPGAETPLVAPGEHVMVDAAGAASAPMCSAGQSFPPPVTLPASLSGSSVAAALVSGAAARAQEARLAARRAPLSQPALSRLLYLTGRGLCRATAAGAPVRELHVGRLDLALSASACEELVVCAEQTTASGVALLQACAPGLVACGLEASDGQGGLAPCAAPGPTALAPPTNYQPAACALSRTAAAVAVPRAACAPACPDDAGQSPSLLGSIGPQPSEGGCPWCTLELGPSPGEVMVGLFELNPAFEPTTTIADPWLVISGQTQSSGQPTTYYVDLSTVTSPAEWYPGAALKLTLDAGALDLDPFSAKASLQVTLQTPDAKYPATDVSGLKVVVRP